MALRYLSNAKQLIREIRSGRLKQQAVGVLRVVDAGIFRAYCVCGVPVILKQYNPNFKIKVHLGSLPLLSLARSPINQTNVFKETQSRRPRIYLNIDSLPYFDNGSGIPRAAKELCFQGLKREDVDCVPVYPDPVTGKYRIASGWLSERHLVTPCLSQDRNLADDPEISVMKGDWLIHTMINANEIDFESVFFNEFRHEGGKVGFILHDLIPEDFPQFYKNRDVVLYRRWLARLHEFDGIFAVSKETLDCYRSWADRTGTDIGSCLGHFHLGANFKKSASNDATSLPKELLSKPFFLQVSTIEPRKGYEQLLNAFELLWKNDVEVNLAIVGRQGWKVRNLCKRISSHPELGRRLFWFRGISDDVLTALYKQCRAVVVASEAEGFGLSVAEGLFHEKEVLARDIPVFREIAGNEASYFDGLEPEAILDAVQKLLRSPVQKRQLAHVTSWQESFDQFFNLIKRFSNESN